MSKAMVPHEFMAQLPGIPGIDGVSLEYGSWHLLNEALTCFANNEYYACTACLSASLELWLKRTLKCKTNFRRLIERAKKEGIISPNEACELQSLRKTRNMYIHFDRTELPHAKSVRTVKVKDSKRAFSEVDELIELQGKEIDPYPTDAHRDVIPLATLAPMSYVYLNSAIRFFMRRYPRKDQLIDSYYRFILIGMEGINENEMFIRLETNRRTETRLLERLFASLRRKFKTDDVHFTRLETGNET
jgi:hypothetical protein